MVRAYCDAEPGSWDFELTAAAQIEVWAGRVRTLTDDLGPAEPVDISDVSLVSVSALSIVARGTAFADKALEDVRAVLCVCIVSQLQQL